MARHDLTYDRLYPWADQPRRSFDEAAIDRLAASIAASGVLQNLVGRMPASFEGVGADELYDVEIVAGGSRLRAIGRLVETGATIAGVPAAAYRIPVEVLYGLDDTAALELATIENLQRRELTPLEEADAFARLVDMGRGTDAIADRIAMTRRYVQMQVRLSKNLAPEAREALAADRINLAAARELCRFPAEAQVEALPDIMAERYGWRTAAEIRNSLTNPLVPVTRALFPVALYRGAFVTIDDDEGETRTFFADTKAAFGLQLSAVENRLAELRGRHRAVHLERHTTSWAGTQLPWRGYEQDAEDDPRDEIVVVLNDLTFAVEEHAGSHRVAEAAEPAWKVEQRRREAQAEEARLGFGEDHVDLVHARRRRALDSALVRDTRAAKAVLLATLLGADLLSEVQVWCGEPENGPAPVVAGLDTLRVALDAATDEPLPWAEGTRLLLHDVDEDVEARLLRACLTLDDEILDRGLAAVTAARFSADNAAWDDPLAASPAETILAETLDATAELAAAFRLDRDWLATLTPAQLVSLAEAIGAPNADEATLLACPLPAGWLPPELAFGGRAAIEARLADPEAWRTACAATGDRRAHRIGGALTPRQAHILCIIVALHADGAPASISRLHDRTGHASGAISQERTTLRAHALLDDDNAPTDLGRQVAALVANDVRAEAAE